MRPRSDHPPMTTLPTRRLLAFACTALLALAAQAAGKPSIGFSLSIETDGFFSTTLKKVTITAVKPGLPADKAGLQAGDEVLAADDIPIAGTPGSKLSGLMDSVKPGDHLKLRVQRGSGEQVVDIIVGER